MTSCDKETVIPVQDVPSEIQGYVSMHFPADSIIRAVKEKGESELFEITLSNGFKLEFNAHYEIIDIDGNAKLPDSVIQSSILDYVSSNYSAYYIIGWEIQGDNQEVQLNSGIVLVFTLSGDFLRIDD